MISVLPTGSLLTNVFGERGLDRFPAVCLVRVRISRSSSITVATCACVQLMLRPEAIKWKLAPNESDQGMFHSGRVSRMPALESALSYLSLANSPQTFHTKNMQKSKTSSALALWELTSKCTRWQKDISAHLKKAKM